MRWVWPTIIADSGIPVALAAVAVNPFTVLVLGLEWWREWIAQFHPPRRRVVFSTAVFAFSLGVYVAHYR